MKMFETAIRSLRIPVVHHDQSVSGVFSSSRQIRVLHEKSIDCG